MTRAELLVKEHLLEPDEIKVLKSLEIKSQSKHPNNSGCIPWNKGKHMRIHFSHVERKNGTFRVRVG